MTKPKKVNKKDEEEQEAALDALEAETEEIGDNYARLHPPKKKGQE